MVAPVRAGFVSDYLGPDHDHALPAAIGSPLRSYVVCSTPRSGSGLLCRGLASTGQLGAPLEYLNPVHRGILSERWSCGADLKAYVSALHGHRTSPEGVFAIKVHWEQLVDTRAEASGSPRDPFTWNVPDELLAELFPHPVFVRIMRMDLDRQAVSLWRAQHSNVWSIATDDEAHHNGDRTPYSFDGIETCRRAIELGESCWDRLLGRIGADPLVVTYEQLTSAFAATVAPVARHVSPGVTVEVGPPSTRAMADEQSDELLGRLLADRQRREPAGPPGPRGSAGVDSPTQ
jgi:LPS sulfotransferase NodH